MRITCMIRGVWHDMTCVRRRGDVWGRVATFVRWGCQREQAAGARKEVNTAILARQDIMGARGDIMEHHGEVQSGGGALRAIVWRRTYLTGNSNYQHASGAFPNDLVWRWRCLNVKDLLWDLYEVHMQLPWMIGGSSRCFSTRMARCFSRSHRVVQDGRYSTRQSNFEQKSIIYGRQTITNLVTWWSSRWSSVWGRV